MLALPAGALLAIAREAADRSRTSTNDSLIATLFSAIAVEAWLNEVLHRVRTARAEELFGPLGELAPLIGAARLEEQGTSFFTRLDVVGTVLTQGRWDSGTQPFQDCHLLMRIRNTLVHQRPENTMIEVWEAQDGSFSFRQERLAGLAEQLIQAKVIVRPDPKNIMPLLAILQQPAVGRWAHDVAVRSITAVTDLLPTPGWKQMVRLGLEGQLVALSRPDAT